MASQFNLSTLSLQDVLDVAVQMEKDAEERYLALVKLVGKRYPGDAADFFTMMAGNERMHGLELMERRSLLFSTAPVNARVASLAPAVDSTEYEKMAPDMTPRQALELAMAFEVKAYEFYDQLLLGNQSLSAVLNPEVRDMIRELRDEEEDHQRLLENMRGWYQGRVKTAREPEQVPPAA